MVAPKRPDIGDCLFMVERTGKTRTNNPLAASWNLIFRRQGIGDELEARSLADPVQCSICNVYVSKTFESGYRYCG